MRNIVIGGLILLCQLVFFPLTASPSLFYSIEKSKREMVNVFVKIEGKENRYARFRIVHENNTAQNKNLWRVMESHFVDYDGSVMVQAERILVPGENELAWFSARPEVKDATGGFHGNERIDVDESCGVTFFADNQELDLSKEKALTSCTSFYYKQRSSMHQTGTGGLNGKPDYLPVPGSPVECFHEKTTSFGKGGFTSYNKLIWAENKALVKRCVHGLFCIDNLLTTEAENDKGEKTVFNGDNKGKLTSEGSSIVYKNVETGLKISCQANMLKPSHFKIKTYVWDTKNYHKYYSIAEVLNAAPRKGEVWEMESRISFSY